MKTLKERQILPKEPTNVTIHVFNSDGSIAQTYEVALHSVRDGFAWTDEDGNGGPYCLDGGWLQCMHDGGIRLSDESLAVCKALVPPK